MFAIEVKTISNIKRLRLREEINLSLFKHLVKQKYQE